jgi:hypothetical protein
LDAAKAAPEDESGSTERYPNMATKKQQAARAKFTRQAKAKGPMKVGRRAKSRSGHGRKKR